MVTEVQLTEDGVTGAGFLAPVHIPWTEVVLVTDDSHGIIVQSARRSTYEDLSFYYYDKAGMQSQWANPVIPVCSIFLDRTGTGEPELQEMSQEDAVSRLRDCTLFEEDPRFHGQILTALTTLAENPVYQLRYDSDPRIAATCIEKMLL